MTEPPSMPLNQQERQFRLLVAGVIDYALYMIKEDGVVASWNAGAERIKGYSAHEIVGQHFSRFYAESDRAAGLPAVALARAREVGRYEAEGWRVRKDGSYFWASVVIDAIYDEQGEFVGFAKITRDITERREAQHQLERLQRQLAQSQKMDALGQLTGGVAHDFNNILMALFGHALTLKKLVGHDPKGIRAIEGIELAAKRGANVTRQLLTFARRQRLNPTSIDIGRLVASVHDVLLSGVGNGIDLNVIIPDNSWPIKADVSELETALVNLAINARDAMPNGGSLAISAQNIAATDSAALVTTDGTQLNGDYVAIAVADSGQGIPPDVLGRIFEPFFTTKLPGKGTGLGLAQVHGFAHQAGGTVFVESILGKGTNVVIYLPRAMTKQGSLDDQLSNTHALSVLLVEDNPEVATATEALLKELQFGVRVVHSADDALHLLAEGSSVDLVLSDIVMPGPMDGLGLARTIRKVYPELPVMLMTGYSGHLRNVDVEFQILNKPFEIGELSRAVARYVRQGNNPR